ncbi:hypothetical protein BT93_E0220 [Corymbia citriodora subsp. variegata]|nr:hypothetical protein BT93_E0220 [Corymbia citriodora subsp. variegata]
MVSALRALLLLTFTVVAMAIAPGPSPIAGVDITGKKFLDFGGPVKCWQVIDNARGCSAQFRKSLEEKNVKFLPNCCKAILGVPFNCFAWIFPLPIFGISFGYRVNKFCNNLLGGKSLPAS